MKIKRILAIALLFSVTQLCVAAGSAKISIDDGHTMQLDWLNNNSVRMSTSHDSSGYLLVLNQQAYAVYKQGKEHQVIDLSSLFDSLGNMAKDASPLELNKELEINWDSSKLKASQKSKTVAGIQGQVYIIDHPQSDIQELVLSNQPLLVEMTQAYFSLLQAMAPHSKENIAVEKALPQTHQGLLAASPSFVVQSLSNKRPKKKLFALPAEPQTLQDMMLNLQQQMIQQLHQ